MRQKTDPGPVRTTSAGARGNGKKRSPRNNRTIVATQAPLDFHPLANIFPLLEGAEFEELVADVRVHGVREPIWTYQGKILDGRNRYRAAQAAGVEARFETFTGTYADALAFVVSKNLYRRHLSESQRAMVAAKIATLKLGDNQHSEGPSIEEASRLLNVGHASVERAKTVQRAGAPELVEAVEHGKLAVSTAADLATLSELSKRTGALVLGVDHFGKLIDTGTRGSSAKEGHADVVLALLGDRQVNGTITNTRLAIRKLRDGPSGLEIPFTPKDVPISSTDKDGKPITDDDGRPETRVVLDWGEPGEAAAPTDDWPPSLQLLRRILMTLLADAGVDVTPYADGPTVRAIDIRLIRAEFCKQYPADGDAKQKAATRRQAFGRAVKLAQSKSLIMVREIDGTQFVWFASKEEPNG